jgi:iron complex transport system permease protein
MTVLLYLVVIGVGFCALGVGRYSIPLSEIRDIFLSRLGWVTPYWDRTIEQVLLDIRTPRIILSILVGGALAVSGASYQTLFKNPLVSPSILGVSSGAAFGAALAMVMNGPWWAVQICALVFGLLAVLGASLISLIFGRRELTVLILGGVVVSSLFGSMLSIIKLVADTDSQLPSIVFWMMGSLGRGTNEDVLVMLGCLAASLLMLYLFRYQINALSAGQDEAASMGVRTGLVKAVVIVSATLMTVSAVSICGIVGWVGMVIPHIARTITGASFPKLTVISFGLGALFLLLVDTLIRGVPGLDLPLGVLTSIIGTPIFVFFLSRVRKGW